MNFLWSLAKYGARSSLLRGENFHKSCQSLFPSGVKPTRPPSSFGLFVQERKNTYLPEMKTERGGFLRVVANEWRSLDFPSKEKYALKAQEAMAAYKASMQSLTDAEKQEILADKKQRQLSKAKKKEIKEKKSSGCPKRSASAYGFFVKHVFATRQISSDVTSRGVMSSVKSRWDRLPFEEKERFAEMAARDKERYLTEMQVFAKRMREEGKENMIPVTYRKMWLPEEPRSWEDLNDAWPKN